MNSTPPITPFQATAAEIAAVLGISPQAIRNKLRNYPSTGKTTVAGNLADTWHAGALPPALHHKLRLLAGRRGFPDVPEMLAAKDAWKPVCHLAEIEDDCLNQAVRLCAALTPSLAKTRLVVSQADFETEGVADYEKVFGKKISRRHFRALVKRTVERDGGNEDWQNLKLYLPKRPARKSASETPGHDFPAIADVVNENGLVAFRELVAAGKTKAQATRIINVRIWNQIFRAAHDLMDAGTGKAQAARIIRAWIATHTPRVAANADDLRKTWDRKFPRWSRDDLFTELNFDGRCENRAATNADSLSERLKPLAWFVPAVRFFYLLTNRTHDSGSLPEAVRLTLSLPNLPAAWNHGNQATKRNLLKALELAELPTFPPDLRAVISDRLDRNQPPLPQKLAALCRVNPSIVQHYRNPREWSLANQSAPGSQRRWFNKATYQREIMQPGDWFGGDDSTPGIAVCVPCTDIATPSSQKFGVLLGRFQWLAYHDCRTDKILAWDYVVRPRGSYRAEDILMGMQAATRTHGFPRVGWQFEGGIFNSKLVKAAIKASGVDHWRTYSPHQKAIEAVFNRMWTRLAVQFPHADMGRFRNENEANCKIYEGCKAGHKDPRRYFPTPEILVKAFEETVAAHNTKRIFSKQYGQWVPDGFFSQSVAHKPLRPYSSEMEWIFAPFVAERTVQGMLVPVAVPMFEGVSVPFEFGANWLPLYHGKKVRLHFNPRLPRCTAKVVLLERANGREAGTVLGNAPLVSETASHIRYILEWGDDNQRAGFIERQKAAQAVRRETRGIGAGGRVEYSHSEDRDGLGKIVTLQRGGNATPPEADPAQSRLAANLAAETREEREADLNRLRQETDPLFA